MPDLKSAADTWKAITDEGTKLKDDLDRLPKDRPLGDDERKKIDALVALADQGISQLRAAADAQRKERVAELGADIDAIETALATNLPPDARDQLRSRQNALRAERAQLELVAAGDFSRVVPPDFVQTLLGHLAAARSEAAAKKRAAAVIPLLLNALQLAVKIAGAVVAAV